MPTTPINVFTIVAAPAAPGSKPTAARSNFVDSLQVAVQDSEMTPPPRAEESTRSQRQDESDDDSNTVEAQQHSADDDNRAENTEATQREGDSDSEQESAEAPDAEDTLVVSNAAAEQIAVEEATAQQLDGEFNKVEVAGVLPDADNEQPSDPELARNVATTEDAPSSTTTPGEGLLAETEAAADQQGEGQPVQAQTATTGEGDESSDNSAPVQVATNESSDTGERSVGDPANIADQDPTTPQKTAVQATATTAAVDKPPPPTEGPAKREDGNKRGEPQPVEAVQPSPERPPEVETETRQDLSGERDADAGQAETREKPAPNSSSFNSILERATGPAARRGNETEQTQNSAPQVDPQRFVSRVSRAFQAAEQRGGNVQLRLSPPELGSLRIELKMHDGALQAKLETETAAAKNVLLDNLPALRDRLAAQEIRVDKFEVDVRQQNSGGQPDWQAQQDQQNNQQHRGGRAVRSTLNSTRTSGDVAPATPTGGAQNNHDGQFSAVA